MLVVWYPKCMQQYATLCVMSNTLNTVCFLAYDIILSAKWFLIFQRSVHNKWVPVTSAWYVHWLWMGEVWRVATNVLNKQSPSTDNR